MRVLTVREKIDADELYPGCYSLLLNCWWARGREKSKVV
jgi:hypothetical protein